jgi:hypothetical protein
MIIATAIGKDLWTPGETGSIMDRQRNFMEEKYEE